MTKKSIRILLLTAGGLFIITGIIRGEMFDVYFKAVNICLECIGIG